MIFGIVKDFGSEKATQILHGNLRLFVKVATPNLCRKLFILSVFAFAIGDFSLCLNFSRDRSNMCLPKRRLRMIISKFDKAQLYLSLHLLRRCINPATLRHLAGHASLGVRNVVARTSAAG